MGDIKCQNRNSIKIMNITVRIGTEVMYYFFVFNLFPWLKLKADEESKFKYMSLSMGMKKVSYWLGTLIFDSFKLAIEIWLFIVFYSLFRPSLCDEIFIDKIFLHGISLLLLSLSFISISYFILFFLKR
jgi:hypothetical protein